MRPSVKKLLLFGTTAPYADAMLALDFVGSRSAGTPYYMLNGVRYPTVTAVPGWTYTGGTPAGTGSYAPKADGSLQFFPSVTNFAFQSQTIDNAGWTKLATTVTANATTAPDGTLTADKLEDTATTNSHGVAEASYGSYGANTYTGSVYVKAAEYGFAFLWIDSGSGDGVTAQINLSTGAATMSRGAGGTWTSPSTTSVNAGNGWWRVTVTGTTTLTAGVQLRVYQAPSAFTTGSYGTPSYAGTAGSGIYIWGAQLELGSTASTYIPTTTAAVTVAPPRITDAGYLAEEARSNSIPNNGTAGAVVGVVGSGGALPTGWGVGGTTGLTHSVVGIGVGPYGPYVDVKLSGTNTSGSTAYPNVYFSSSTTIVAATGQSWASSVYVALVGGSLSGVTQTYLNVIEATAAGVYISNGTSNFTPTADTSRPTLVRTFSGGATVARTYMAVNSQIANGASVDFTLRLSLPQQEQGSFATSPIPTTSVAVTRAADVGYISGLTVPAVKTLFANVSGLAQDGVERTLISVNDGSSVNRVNLYRNSSNAMQSVSTVASTSAYTNAVGSFTGAFVTSAATSNSATEMVTAAGGSTTPVRSTSSVAMTTVSVGTGPAAVQPMNGPIRRIVIYPRAMSNAELQAITLPTAA